MIQIWTDSLFIELLNDINKEVWCCRSFSQMVAETRGPQRLRNLVHTWQKSLKSTRNQEKSEIHRNQKKSTEIIEIKVNHH